VTLIGHSAGGHLALWATSREDSALRFRRVIAQAPVVNLTVTPAARDLMGGSPEQVPERYALGNPMQLLPLGLPMLLVHTPDDATIPVVRTREFAEAARAAGDEIGLVEPYPGGHRSHIDPRTKAWEAAVEWLAEAKSPSPLGVNAL
jgi:alpha-beta hydrolase superfamily lysophospholipase